MKTDWPKSFLEWRDGDTLNISVPFTWLLPAVQQRIDQRTFDAPKRIRVGGPAVALMPDYLKAAEVGGEIAGVLQRFNPQATRTTVGCPRRCPFCAVPKVEGSFAELADWPDGPIICDNNLLRASIAHFDRVCDRLERWGWADFNQGLDARYMTRYHADRLKRIGHVKVRMALDNQAVMPAWEQAFKHLRDSGIARAEIGSYVLCAFDSGPDDAWDRCYWVEMHGTKAYPMWYHPLYCLDKNAVTREQAEMGWNDYQRRKLMQWFYKHKNAVA